MKPPTGHTPVYALLGRPVRHSLSPRLHNHWFDELGIDGVYVALELPEQPHISLATTIRDLGLAGVNLTVPFKQRLLSALDERHATVIATGAANVVVNREGRLLGYNTDGDGFIAGLHARFGPITQDATCAILGAGGAARAIAHALLGTGARAVHILNRTQTRAEQLARHLAPTDDRVLAHALRPQTFAPLAPSIDLVVNATTGPAAPAVHALDVQLLPPSACWVDLNYWQADPPALARCTARGLRTQSGLPMLVHQAALTFELFTGHRPDAAATLRTLAPLSAQTR